jgi:hypothetical protein
VYEVSNIERVGTTESDATSEDDIVLVRAVLQMVVHNTPEIPYASEIGRIDTWVDGDPLCTLVQQGGFDPVGIDVDFSADRQQMPREFDIHSALSVAGNDIMGNNRNPHGGEFLS